MNNREIADTLERVGDILELRGDNPFKVKAYHTAAQTIADLSYSLAERWDGKDHPDIPGIGVTMEKNIRELLATGKLKLLEDMETEVTPDLLEMLRIPGLGPRKLRQIIDALDINTIGELEYAVRENRIKLLKGFGEKTQENILRGIALVKSFKGRLLFPVAMDLARGIQERISGKTGVESVYIAGPLRRCMETIQSVSLVVSVHADDRASALESISQDLDHTGVLSRSEEAFTCRLSSGPDCQVRLTDSEHLATVLLDATGSDEHLTALRTHAASRGFSLDARGLRKKERRLKTAHENDVYRLLGMDYIPPELRENRGEIEAALEHLLPELVTREDIRGAFHVHTAWSDGSNSIGEMANAARDSGLEYIGIADHSVSAGYAGGLTEDSVRRQWDEIDRINAQERGFHIFKGTECDIRSDGSLDFSEHLLQGFDFVVVSIHNRFKMTREEATERIVRAIGNPYATMLGHPTGRLLLAREGYPLDMERILDACARNHTVIELNSDPHRLDLDWRYIRAALERGVPVSINPDAHSVTGFSVLEYGVNIARKGWLQRPDVFNCLSLDAMRTRIQDMKRKKMLVSG